MSLSQQIPESRGARGTAAALSPAARTARSSASVLFDVDGLGGAVQRAWDAAHRDERALPGIALDALAEFPPPAFELADVTRHLIEPRTVQDLAARQFSDMPLVVYRGAGFYIELLIWVDGSTSIHQHGFSGVFRVIAGSSLHSLYEFRPTRRINSRAFVGDIRCVGLDYLRTGDQRRITSGPRGLAHALFHLDRPSITLVIRTVTDPDSGPQLSLHPPSLALHHRRGDSVLDGLDRWFRAASKLGPGALPDTAMQELPRLDFERCAALVLRHPRAALAASRVTPWLRAIGAASPLRAALASAYGAELADVLVRALLEAEKFEDLVKMRGFITDPDLRFFVALLLNGRSSPQIQAAILKRTPGANPVAFCADAIVKLASSEYDALAERFPWTRALRENLRRAGDDAPAVVRRVLSGGRAGRLSDPYFSESPHRTGLRSSIVGAPAFEALLQQDGRTPTSTASAPSAASCTSAHGSPAPGSKTLADELAALRGLFPRALAPDAAWTALVEAAGVVPAVAVRFSGYEFHLGTGPARIDVSAGVVPDGPLAAHLLAAGDRGPASGRLAGVVRAIAAPGGALSGCRLAILEYDSRAPRSSSAPAAGGPGSAAPPLPGVFLTLRRWPAERHDALVKLLAGEFPALMGLPELTGLAPRLSSLLNGLPQGAFLSNAGLFPARSTSALRVVVAGVRARRRPPSPEAPGCVAGP